MWWKCNTLRNQLQNSDANNSWISIDKWIEYKWRNSFWCDEFILLQIDFYPAIDRIFFSNLIKIMVAMLASNRIKLITKKCGIKSHPLKVKCARDSIVGYTNGGNMNGSNLTFSMTLLIFMKQSQRAWCFFHHSFFLLRCIYVLFNC